MKNKPRQDNSFFFNLTINKTNVQTSFSQQKRVLFSYKRMILL